MANDGGWPFGTKTRVDFAGLWYYPGDGSGSPLYYSIGQLHLGCGLATGGSSGVSCEATVVGMGRTEVEMNQNVEQDGVVTPAGNNSVSPYIFTPKFTVGNRAVIRLEYTVDADYGEDEDVADTIIDGRIIAVNTSIQGVGKSSVSLTIATNWDCLATLPPSSFYLLISAGTRQAVASSPGLFNAAIKEALTKKAGATNSNGFNVAEFIVSALDNIGDLKKLAGGVMTKGDLAKFVDTSTSPLLPVTDTQATSLYQYLFQTMSRQVPVSTYKAVLSDILNTFWMLLAPRKNEDGEWTFEVLPNNMWDDPISLSLSVRDQILSFANASIILALHKISAGVYTNEPATVAVRYAGQDPKSTNLGMAMCYDEGCKDGRPYAITAVDLKKRQEVGDWNKGAAGGVVAMRSIIFQNLPTWVLFAGNPTDEKRSIVDNLEQQKSWAEFIAKATFITRNRQTSSLAFQAPFIYYKEFINAVGKCIKIALGDTDDINLAQPDEVYIGRVESVTLDIRVEDRDLTSTLMVSLNGVHTEVEHDVLRVPSDALFVMQQDDEEEVANLGNFNVAL